MTELILNIPMTKVILGLCAALFLYNALERKLLLSPVIVALECYLSNWGTDFLIDGVDRALLANHLVDFLSYVLAALAISKLVESKVIFWVYFILVIFHFSYVYDYHFMYGENIYQYYKPVVMGIQFLIMLGLVWDTFIGGKKDVDRHTPVLNVPIAADPSYNGNIGAYQAKTRR